MISKNLQLLEEFNQAFNQHDVERMMRLMSEDCVFENTLPAPDGASYTGQAAIRSFWQSFFAASPGARIEIEEMFGEGNRLCQRWVYSWQGEQPGHVRGVDVLHVRDGKIARKLSYVKG